MLFKTSVIIVAFLALGSSACTKQSLVFQEKQQLTNGDNLNNSIFNIQLRMGTRQFVSSQLNSIFGPSVSSIVTNAVQNNPYSFGGPCDRYSSQLNANGCDAESQAPVLPPPSPGRSAYMMRACDQVGNIDAAILYGAANVLRVDPGGLSAASLQVPTQAQIESMYDLFSPGRPVSSDVILALHDLAVASQSAPGNQGPIDAWRFAFVAICQSPTWQIL